MSLPEPERHPYDFPCPTCKAKAGERCVTKDGGPTSPHARRHGPLERPQDA